MMNKFLIAAAVTGLAVAFVAAPAAANDKMTCEVASADMRSIEALKAQLAEKGWDVRKAKTENGCYEVQGKDPQGREVKATFDPASFEMLMLARGGETLFRKAGR